MNPKKSDTQKKLLDDGITKKPLAAPAVSTTELEFVPLQDISVENKPGRDAQPAGKKEATEDAEEQPVLIYKKNAREERPILDVRKPGFRPDIKQKTKKGSQKARIELPEE